MLVCCMLLNTFQIRQIRGIRAPSSLAYRGIREADSRSDLAKPLHPIW
jgi:hypothetical protein